MSNGPEYRLVYKGVDRGPSVKHFKYIKRVRQGNKWKYFYDDDSKGGKNNKKITESSKVKTPVKEKIKDKLGYDERERVKTADLNRKLAKQSLEFERDFRDDMKDSTKYLANKYGSTSKQTADARKNYEYALTKTYQRGMEYSKADEKYKQAKEEYHKTPIGKVDAVKEKINDVKANVKNKLGYDERERLKTAYEERKDAKTHLNVARDAREHTERELEYERRRKKYETGDPDEIDANIDFLSNIRKRNSVYANEAGMKYAEAAKNFEKRQQEFYETPLGKIEQAKEKIEDGKDYIEELLAAAKKKRRDKKYERKKKRHESKRTVGDGGTRINDNVTMETD